MTTAKASQILQQMGLSSDAARKAISRKPLGVSTLFSIPFPKRARFVFLSSQFNTELYWNSLHEAIRSENPPFAAALAAFASSDGLMLADHFDTRSGSPILQKGQTASSAVLKGLLAAKLVSSVTVDGFGECLVRGRDLDLAPIRIKILRARILAERVLLDALRAWAGKMNLSTTKTIKIRGDIPAPQVSTFRFDLSGPSYLQPFLNFEAGKAIPGFLAVDVALGEELDEVTVTPFLRKCTMLANLRGARPVLPMLIANSFTLDALRLCRSKGIIATRADTVFGRDVARALEDLITTLSNVTSTPSQIESLFKRLGAVEGAAINLRGALFELVVAHCVRSIEGGTVDVGFVVADDEQNRAEIDVRLIRERHVAIYECKGYQPASRVSLREVEVWLSKKVPTIYRAMKRDDRFSTAHFRFEFWTCGEFATDALEALKIASGANQKYVIAWKNGKGVRNYASQLSAASGIKKVLDEHYFDHPLAKVQREASAAS